MTIPTRVSFPRRERKKTPNSSHFLEVKNIPKKLKRGLLDKSVGDMLMDMELFKNKYNRV